MIPQRIQEPSGEGRHTVMVIDPVPATLSHGIAFCRAH
jgi:hypothetical protein